MECLFGGPLDSTRLIACTLHAVSKAYLRNKTPTRLIRSYPKPRKPIWPNWIVTQGNLGYAPSYSRFRLFAQHRLIHNGGLSHFGKNWHRGFLARNPSIQTIKGKTINYKRLNGTTQESLKILFENLNLNEVKDISAKHRYNADEFGLMEGVGDNALVLGESYRKYILLKDPLKRQWITILACVSADARALPSLVIFCGKNVQQWFPNKEDQPYEDWYFTTSANGWTNNDIAVKWLTEVFIPYTKPDHPDQWHLLILDGHGSHKTDGFMWMCLIHKITVVFLPAHSSHVFQPLDVGIFAVLKKLFRPYVRTRLFGRLSEDIEKEDFLYAISKASNTAMRPRYITLVGNIQDCTR